MSKHFVRIDAFYEGDLRCRAKHEPSGAEIVTDAPVDNCGKGESFSPTDLAATGIGVCMMTIMGIFAERHSVELKGMSVSVKKEMVQVPVRRIGRLTVDFKVPLPADHEHRDALERAAMTCPVFMSLHPDLEKVVSFSWQG